MKRVVVIGGDAAGMSAASQAQRGTEPVDLVVFERGRYTSYAACGLPYLVGGLIQDSSRLVVRTAQQHRDRGIDVRIGHEVLSIDLDSRTVEVRDSEAGTTAVVPFDELVIATGASPIRPPFPNVDAGGVFGIHTIPDALAIEDALLHRDPRRAVVVGGGYIGLEMAEALVRHGLAVTLVEKLPQPMATLDPDMGQRVAEAMARSGIELALGVGVEGFEVGNDRWVRAVATEGGEFEADIVVMGLGVRPNSQLAADGGVPLGPTGAIATDARMSTTISGVWAAGDCAESFHRVSGRPAWIALGTHANKHGRVVGLNLSGTHARFPGVIGTAVTKVDPVEIGRTGLSSREAVAAGFDVVAETIEGASRAHYYPDGEPLAVKIIAERGSGRMLGAQIVGGAESAKRIDALAVAIWNEMTVEQFAQLDLGYAPPFAPVWEAGLIAARRAGEHVR